jgi:chromate reductase, NAD(P)H dehydrogenase (quinone)
MTNESITFTSTCYNKYHLYHFRQIFVYLNMYPINGPEGIVPFAQNKFDANRNLVDKNTRMFVRQITSEFCNLDKKIETIK